MKEPTGYLSLVMVGTRHGRCPGRRKGIGTVCLAFSGMCQVAVSTQYQGWGTRRATWDNPGLSSMLHSRSDAGANTWDRSQFQFPDQILRQISVPTPRADL